MGMYDDLIFKGQTYQTKSLYCTLDQYEIRNDGTLWHETSYYEDVPEEEWDYIELPGGKRLPAGIMRKVPTGWEPVKLTKEVRFYRYDWSNEEQKTRNYTEYSAYFVRGKLKELHKIRREE